MSEETNPNISNENQLLASLPPTEYKKTYSKLEQFSLNYGETIYEVGEEIRYVYFPNSGIISLLAAVEESSTLEVGIVGKEGVVGLALFLGVTTSNNLAIVQGTGAAMRMSAADFLAECENNILLTRILQRFTHSLLTQVSQSAVCYRFHPIEARLARWLLMTSDRMETQEFQITQEFLSNMLGVRREAVNKSAVILQQQHLITYSRGKVSIINLTELEKTACRCYGIIKEEEVSFPVK